jgi:hypothetical protein
MEPEVRSIRLAIMSGFGNLAQVYLGNPFPNTDALRYLEGFATYAGILRVGATLYVPVEGVDLIRSITAFGALNSCSARK